MMVTRVSRTPVTEDVQRLAERVFNEYGGRIRTYEDFRKAWDAYMEGEPMTHRQEVNLRETVFDVMKDRYESVRDTRETGRVVEEDKKGRKRVKRGLFQGFIKGEPVTVYQDAVTINDTRRTVYRDSKGRFAKVPEERKQDAA